MKTICRITFAFVTAPMLAAIVLASMLPSLVAQDAASASTQATPANAVTNMVRDPFWPVGYWPKPKVAVATTNINGQIERVVAVTPPPPEDPPKWPDLRVTGAFGPTPSGYVATFDGISGNFSEGQLVRKVEGKYEYTWKIVKILASRKVSYTRLNVRKIK